MIERLSLDLLLFHISARDADGRSQRRLVLRRTVYAPSLDGDAVAVEEMWVSETQRHHRVVAQLVRGLGSKGTDLLQARPLAGLPGMSGVTSRSLEELGGLVEPPATIVLLAVVRTVIDGLSGERPVREAQLSCSAGLLGATAGRMFGAAITVLGLVPAAPPEGDSEPDDPGGVDVTGVHGALEVAAHDTIRALLDRDLAGARDRLDAAAHWASIRDARLVLLPEPSSASVGSDRPQWTHWERGLDDTSRPDGTDEDYVVILIGVDGAMVGQGRQYNLFRYRLEPTIDLDAVLADPEVRAALVAFASSGGDRSARAAAVMAIRTCRAGGHSDWAVEDQHIDPLPCSPGTSMQLLGGAVLVCDCRGVQVGNHLRQYNTFASVLTPTVAAHDLLRDDPALVGLLVDYACAGGVTARTVRDELSEAVCSLADAAHPDLPANRLHSIPSAVHGGRGIGVGDVRQHDRQEFAARLPAAVARAAEETEKATRRELRAIRVYVHEEPEVGGTLKEIRIDDDPAEVDEHFADRDHHRGPADAPDRAHHRGVSGPRL